ncbi:molybdopterin-dependent oxidoreductase [Ilumatobacter sp.]|uniref:molybdopterin-dependent oxidoreductase n=1 Tax=Ilumatobacter sp. TaxID=1967498 RepID=UPI003B52A53C
MQRGLYEAPGDEVVDDAPGATPPDVDEPVGRDPRTEASADGVRRRTRWAGVLLGLVATGGGLGVAELVVALVRGSASPLVPVGQEFIDITPAWLKDWAIQVFGTGDKLALVAGALVVILGLGSVVGMLAVRSAMGAAVALTGAIGFVGAWAVLVRPEPSLAKLLPTTIGTVVSLLVLRWLAPIARAACGAGGGGAISVPAPASAPDRRRFLTGAAGIGSSAVVSAVVGRILRRRFEIDDERSTLVLPDVVEPSATGAAEGSSLDVDGITPFVVPTGDFYRIDTALVVPQVSRDEWSLTIGGMVDRPRTYTFDDLLALPQMERQATLSCVSNPVGGDLVGNAVWQGVSFADVLRSAGIRDGATQVVSRSVDGWTAGSPTEVIMDGRDAMLAYAMNGEPLPAEHGYPVRIVVPGLYGYVSATKWVSEIELTRWEDFDAYWVPRGWSKTGPVKTMARIDTPRTGASRSGVVPVGGVAWAVHVGISAVQVRIDGGEWIEAELGDVPSRDTWRQWVLRWDTSSVAPGEHVVEVRALDGDGQPQPEQPKAVAPDGAQGYHRIRIETS